MLHLLKAGAFAAFVASVLACAGCASTGSPEIEPEADPFAEYVWPPPPNDPRIKLVEVITGRRDVEASSKLQRSLLGASPQSPFDDLKKPFGVEYDSQGRILVTDAETKALLRFDRKGRRMDVFGTQGRIRLKLPLGVEVGPDETIYVADANSATVVAFDPDGDVTGVYGQAGDLQNPTDVAVAPDGERLFVADSKAHRIAIFDLKSGDLLRTFGERGEEPGQFQYPTSLAFTPEGELYVVDQLNSRVQLLSGEGEVLDEFGALGVGFANFVRPKDVAVDEVGFIYVTDYAFNNVQIFDIDFALLTFVGEGGSGPGQFHGASGIDVLGDEFAVVDQLGGRVQIFRFIVPKSD